MPTCWHCKAEFTAAHHDRVVYNKMPLYAEWSGWRMSGRFLIGPRGSRFTQERLAALAWADVAEKKTGKAWDVLLLRRQA